MITIALVLAGIIHENFHIDILKALGKYLPASVIVFLNNALKDLPAPIEYSIPLGFIKADIMFGADTLLPAADSKALLALPTGTIKSGPVAPGVIPLIPADTADDSTDTTTDPLTGDEVIDPSNAG